MKRFINSFIIWVAGIDLGLCLGNQAAGGVSIPQAWFGAFLLTCCALVALIVGGIQIGNRTRK